MKIKPYIVLVGMDFSELADRALQQALELHASPLGPRQKTPCALRPAQC